jgi:transcriptional accessory protein Tex/SPT6
MPQEFAEKKFVQSSTEEIQDTKKIDCQKELIKLFPRRLYSLILTYPGASCVCTHLIFIL